MYAGSMVEQAEKKILFTRPQYPYTIALLNAIPRPELRDESLQAIPGAVCNLFDPPPGCKFHPRLPRRRDLPNRNPQLEESCPTAGCPVIFRVHDVAARGQGFSETF